MTLTSSEKRSSSVSCASTSRARTSAVTSVPLSISAIILGRGRRVQAPAR
jgi:hypothetical protein